MFLMLVSAMLCFSSIPLVRFMILFPLKIIRMFILHQASYKFTIFRN
uniref:Uncharacterized protein n=1 Tax=Schistosoma japonicum TaxID=6182 RepID=Q5BZM1_SCHJA|nr:unknown [Schistosoma japonicum]